MRVMRGILDPIPILSLEASIEPTTSKGRLSSLTIGVTLFRQGSLTSRFWPSLLIDCTAHGVEEAICDTVSEQPKHPGTTTTLTYKAVRA